MTTKASEKPARKVSEEPECLVDPNDHFKIYINPDGSVTRNELPLAPAVDEDDSAHGQSYFSKDITLNADNKTWMRIFRPAKLPSDTTTTTNNNNNKNNTTTTTNNNNKKKLPIIVYFHSGAFILYHPDTMLFNESCGRFSSEIPSIVLSVEYRLAPENRLPAAYQDAQEAIIWVKQQALDPNGDQWLRNYGDFDRCYIMGCCSGGNIAYQAGLMLPELELQPIKIAGIILNQPLFGGIKWTRSEIKGTNDVMLPKSGLEMVWEWALPEGSDRDHEYSNPLVNGSRSQNIKALPRTLIRGFDGDVAVDRQMGLVKMLMKHGVQVTAHFGEIGFHAADMFDAKRHLALLHYLKDFVN